MHSREFLLFVLTVCRCLSVAPHFTHLPPKKCGFRQPVTTRAIADALPFLQQAKEVRVFTVVGDNSVHALRSLAKLAKHLARHGVEIVSEDVKCNGRAIGDVFSAYVLEHKINLLVMGAYGHSRFREFILGGATESMLDRPPSWILLSH